MSVVSVFGKRGYESNVSRFMVFRLLFSARFYYPVFTILFLDYGLTLEQFALLNLVWALTIVVAEVPSGALADVFGRRRMVVAAALLMVVEMALLAFVPLGGSWWLFAVFCINRICSGLAEAAASGADEALAYDSLVEQGRQGEWARVLEITTRLVSAGFFITMITGALAYDGEMLNRLLGWVEPSWVMERERIIRLPVYLTLFTAVIGLFTVLGMVEVPVRGVAMRGNDPAQGLRQRLAEPFVQVWQAGRWALGHRFVLLVIIAALALDSVPRQLIILASEYYRLIGIPTAWFGFIGAGAALLGMLTATLSKWMVTRCAVFTNFMVLSLILITGLTGVTFMLPVWGVFFAIGAFAVMGMVNFQASYYINREVESRYRATVLSFKGLALNLGLGVASLLYTLLIVVLKTMEDPLIVDTELKEAVFRKSLQVFPGYYAILFAMVLILGRVLIRRKHLCFEKPSAAGG